MYGLDGAITAFMVVSGLIGAAIMAVLFWGVPWVWDIVKPWLHAVTG